MSYKSFSVTGKELNVYYLPKKNVYDLILGSINSVGYGQAIYNFNTSYDYYLNSLNIWDDRTQSMVIYDLNSGQTYPPETAGPDLWGVSSQQGLDFLNGYYDIPGLVKLKYCNSCSDGNGLKVPTISTFSRKFGYLDSLISEFGTTKGYLFYDWSQPLNQNFYPSVFDPNIGNYIFKDFQGLTKTELQVAASTGIPREQITTSINNSEPLKPVECKPISYSYSTSEFDVCSNRPDLYELDTVNSVLYELGGCGSLIAAVGYYSDGENVYYFDGELFDKYGPCPSNLIIQACCSGQQLIISGSFNVGDVIYTKDVNPAVCFEVISTTSDSPTSSFNFVLWRTDCTECIQLYPGGCKK